MAVVTRRCSRGSNCNRGSVVYSFPQGIWMYCWSLLRSSHPSGPGLNLKPFHSSTSVLLSSDLLCLKRWRVVPLYVVEFVIVIADTLRRGGAWRALALDKAARVTHPGVV